MGDELKVFTGECFVTVNEDQAGEHVQNLVDKRQEEIDTKQDRLEELQTQMKDLKTYLYIKFGTSINLDEQEE